MENEWKVVNLGDISTMKFGKGQKKCMDKGVRRSEKCFYPEPELIVIARGVADTGDVKISPPRSFISNASIIVRLKENVADKRFYYYYLKTRNLRSISSSLKKPRITIANLKKVKVKMPPLVEQKKIGLILSTFDNKIKQNIKMSKALEKICQAIFKHWFIDFEFPNDDGKPYKSYRGEFINTKWGLLPKGWRVGKYTEIVDAIKGTSLENMEKEYWGGDLPLYTSKDVRKTSYVSNTHKSITKSGLSKYNGKVYPRDTVFIPSKGSFDRVNINAIPMALDQSCYALLGMEDVGQYYVYMLTKNCDEKRSDNVFNIDMETFESLNIIIPTKSVIKKFQNTVTPLFTKMKQLSITNNGLSKLRNRLLPKLISGDVRVV